MCEYWKPPDLNGGFLMSVYPHSSSDTYFIYCVGQSLVTIAAFKTAMASEGIWAKPLYGKYKGATEHSFISQMKDYPTISPWLDEEESILHIHNFNARDEPKATLLFLKEGREEYLGRFVGVSRDEAVKEDNYTFDFTYNNY
jgi:hypothetical protein